MGGGCGGWWKVATNFNVSSRQEFKAIPCRSLPDPCLSFTKSLFFQTISMFLDSGRLNVYQRFVKIFQHNGNEGFFQLKGADNTDKTDAMEKNPDNPEADLFSLLSKLDQYKRQGKIS